MTPEQMQLLETWGIVGGMTIMVIIMLITNAEKIGSWFSRLIERFVSHKEREQNWERDWQSTLAQNGHETKQRLLKLYEQIREEERGEKRRLEEQVALERADMRRWREEEQRKQDEISAVMIDTVQTAMSSIDAFAEAGKEQMAILQKIRSCMADVKVALEQSSLINSQLILLLERSPGDVVEDSFTH